ncbi:hypothetical protein AVEN_32042-1 [Araneus ventricosus]|uniref:Uncharacterized protein n=1 Tax=Araneus ventricosus TaxID=182803 RepID=A0A4Y2JUB1_ARAVE|nr:hypothetical protein AVEN_32042-1 [Araneus ventricosus]
MLKPNENWRKMDGCLGFRIVCLNEMIGFPFETTVRVKESTKLLPVIADPKTRLVYSKFPCLGGRRWSFFETPAAWVARAQSFCLDCDPKDEAIRTEIPAGRGWEFPFETPLRG